MPPYWETTILAPSGIGGELLVDGLPAGSLLSFMSNMLISFSFQFVGQSHSSTCLLTPPLFSTRFSPTRLHAHLNPEHDACRQIRIKVWAWNNSHPVRHVSTFLSLTLFLMCSFQFRYGFYLRSRAPDAYTQPSSSRNRPWPWGTDVSTSPFNSTTSSSSSSGPAYPADDDAFPANDLASANEWLSFLLMTIGWFITLTSALGYYRVKRWERGIKNSTPAQPQARMSPEADAAVRRTLSTVFGFGAIPMSPSTAATPNLPDEERAARIEEAHQLDARLVNDRFISNGSCH